MRTKNDTLGVMNDALRRTDVDVEGGRLAVWSGDGGGRPGVFLHGGGLDHRMWDRQASAFAVTNRVVLVDARGHGESSTPTHAHRHCDDLAVALRALGVGP